MDINENGIVDALEFGYQVWDNGRLISLDLSYNEDVIMKPDNANELDTTNSRLRVIPDNIGDFDALKYLILNYIKIKFGLNLIQVSSIKLPI